jgi:glycerol-3-phosphate acyltransferase PlsY
MPYAVLVAGAFLCGAIPFGVIVSRAFYGRDIRKSGSGNIGAANALRTMGKGAALAVLLLDAGKGALPVIVARQWLGDDPALLAAFAAVVGHCYSPFLGFRGGKGVATYLGAIVALAWPSALVFGLLWIACGVAFGYASLASLVGCTAAAITLTVLLGPAGAVFGGCSLALILFMHRGNVARLRAGSEPVLSLFRRGAA